MQPLENKRTNQQDVRRITTAIKSRSKKSYFRNVNSGFLLTPRLLLFSCVSTARGVWISWRMFHPEGSFSVIWHLFNICSPAVARQCGLYTAEQLERQNDWLIDGTGFMWSIGQYASDLKVGATCEMEIKVWPSIVGKYRDLWLM